MKIVYNIPTQTVTLEIAPAELAELGDQARARMNAVFAEISARLREACRELQRREDGK